MKNSNDPKSTAGKEEENQLSPLEQKLATWFPDIQEAVRVKLLVFLDELQKATKTTPLLAGIQLKNPESTCIADAIYASRLMAPKLIPNQPLVEFGSGNGLPGIVFALLYPQIKVVTLEKDSRRVEFLRSASSKLALANYQVQSATLDEAPERSIFNLVARSAFPLHKTLLAARKSVPKGGKFFQIRGDGWANELAGVPSQLFSFWNPNLLGTYKLPETTHEMAVLLTDKSAD